MPGPSSPISLPTHAAACHIAPFLFPLDQGEVNEYGRSRGGFTTKIHVRCEGYGKPVTFALTGGQVHDSQRVTALIDRGAIRRIGRGRPRLRPAKLAGDKAYSSRSIRQALRK